MRTDLIKLSTAPTADKHTDADVGFDNMNLLEYLDRKAGNVIKAAIAAAYTAEFGLELYASKAASTFFCLSTQTKGQSLPLLVSLATNVITSLAATSKLSRVFATNDPGQINLGMRLVKVRKNAMNRIELTS